MLPLRCSIAAMPHVVNVRSVYYEPPGPKASDLAVMRRIDEQYTSAPFYGAERMTAVLRRAGIGIGHNRVRRLMRRMGLEAICPKPRLSQPNGQEHREEPKGSILGSRTREKGRQKLVTVR